ncbi:uncharacterized protein LOC141817133 [Curcuma longa]|uniref:uncharacterized protein LOC141817133 n=1 Tax=Curcuma longa TaxID=136217 RepID=UPI003D9E9E2F
MASSSANQIPLFFFFFFLFLLQIVHARDSRQFFSKTTREPATKALAPSETTTNVNAHQDTPTLTPQTHNNNGYGLYDTRTSTVVGTYNYNGGRSRPADDSQEYSSEVYSYGKQWRPIDDSNRPREFENQIDHDAQSLYSANDDERNYKYPDSRYSNSRWKGNTRGYGVYNYNGGTSGGYYESSGRYGYGSGYGHNDAKEEEYQNKNHEMEENQEEFTP